MKILHILNEGSSASAAAIIRVHAMEHEVRIVDLSVGDISYDDLVDDIFSYDRVISWP